MTADCDGNICCRYLWEQVLTSVYTFFSFCCSFLRGLVHCCKVVRILEMLNNYALVVGLWSYYRTKYSGNSFHCVYKLNKTILLLEVWTDSSSSLVLLEMGFSECLFMCAHSVCSCAGNSATLTQMLKMGCEWVELDKEQCKSRKQWWA